MANRLKNHTKSIESLAPEKSEVATELVNVVEAFIAAGEKNDPAARGKYLAPSVFYYGHARTRAQALREITSLYRQWPERKFGPVEAIDLFEIPKHPGVLQGDCHLWI